MTWGVTSTGFVMPTLPEIIDDMSTTAKELFGSNVDTEVWSSLGMFIRTIAAENLLTWQGMQDLYYVSYLDYASGQNLDDLLAMFAFNRRIAEKATGYVAFTGTVGTSIPGSTVIKTLGDDPVSFKTVDPLTITEMITNGEFTTDTASWTAENAATLAAESIALDFTSGGTYVIAPADAITGTVGGATAVVSTVVVSSGTWAGGDAAGTLYINTQVGTFEAEDLDIPGHTNSCTIAADSTSLVDSGNCLVVICDGTNNPYAEQQISVDEFLFYDLSVIVRKYTEATYNVIVRDMTNAVDIYDLGSPEETADDWSTTVTQRIEIPEDCTTIAIQLIQKATAGAATTLLFDNVLFTAVGTNIIAVDAALAGNVPLDNIIVLETPISGIVSVTNPNATTGGRDKELDAVYRARYKLSTMVIGNATLNAIVASVLAVSNVSSATIEENDTAIDYIDMLLNSGFPTDTTSWVANNDAVLASVAGGNPDNCLRITGGGAGAAADPFASQTITVVTGDTYTLHVDLKKGTEEDYNVDVYDNDHANYIYQSGDQVAAVDWGTLIDTSFAIPAGCTSVDVRLKQKALANTADTIYFDTVLFSGLPPHSVRVSVQGGTDTDVAQALLDSVAGGITTYGDESGTGEIDNGQTFDRYFTRPDQILIDVAATIASDDAYAGDTAVETAIIDYIGGTDDDGTIHTGLGADDNVVFYEIVSAIMDVVGVTNVSALTINKNGSPPGTIDIPITAAEVAYASTASVTIS